MSDAVQALMARQPKVAFRADLPAAAKAEFAARGFTKVERITSDEEISWLRDVYDALFCGEGGAYVVRDVMTRIDQQRGDRTSQVIRPESYLPELKTTAFWSNSRRLAAELLDLDQAGLDGWGHMIRKAPGDDESLPYHQDEAFWDPHFDYHGLGVWMPLDPATVESGCMSLAPGSHLEGVREHRLGKGRSRGHLHRTGGPAARSHGAAPHPGRRRLVPPLPHHSRLGPEPQRPTAAGLCERVAGRPGQARDAKRPPVVVATERGHEPARR